MSYSKKERLSNLALTLHNTFPELDTLQINNIHKPLIICDADEVIFDFMNSFEKFLHSNSLHFSWNSYALDGNILNDKKKAISKNEIHEIIQNFFKKKTTSMELVKDASYSLRALADRFNIVILSNIPFQFYEKRKKALIKYNLNFPFFANKGPKGKAVKHISKIYKGDLWFIDDSPYQVKSVKLETEKTNTILFISNKKLERLMNNKNYGDFFSNTWKKNVQIISTRKNNL